MSYNLNSPLSMTCCQLSLVLVVPWSCQRAGYYVAGRVPTLRWSSWQCTSCVRVVHAHHWCAVTGVVLAGVVLVVTLVVALVGCMWVVLQAGHAGSSRWWYRWPLGVRSDGGYAGGVLMVNLAAVVLLVVALMLVTSALVCRQWVVAGCRWRMKSTHWNDLCVTWHGDWRWWFKVITICNTEWR